MYFLNLDWLDFLALLAKLHLTWLLHYYFYFILLYSQASHHYNCNKLPWCASTTRNLLVSLATGQIICLSVYFFSCSVKVAESTVQHSCILQHCSPTGRQLTIFNSQTTIQIGGWERDRSRSFQGQLSGLYYNGLKVFNMAAEGDPNIRIQGSVRLVGDSGSSITPQSSTTANRSETSTSIMEITTTTTASSRRVKQTTPREPQQVRSSLKDVFLNHFHLCRNVLNLIHLNALTMLSMKLSTSWINIIHCIIRLSYRTICLTHPWFSCVISFGYQSLPHKK